ncbi:MAG: glycosyltransferase family 2 protein [Tissierellia bacterium]|nr:glycosyltransferase family 2 protein [Tissierellia bacterium]
MEYINYTLHHHKSFYITSYQPLYIMRPDLSVIIPTYNEQLTIQDTIQKLSHTLRLHPTPFEIIIVDDNSTDKTQLVVTDLILRKYPVVLITRTKDPGLSQSVLEGIKRVQGSVVVVTDADLSHDISLIPSMYNEIKNNNTDIVIGSRYMPNGGIEDWPIKRRVISWGATFLGRLLFPQTTDPVSGFFAIKKNLVLNTPHIKPRGYKILLEFLGKCRWHTFKEIPYTFQNRKDGESKLGLKQITQYIHQIFDIAIFPGRAQEEIKRMVCFGIVGITGIAVNMITLVTLKNYLPLLGASFIAIELSIISNYILNDLWTFKENNTGTWLHRMISYNGIAIGGMVINMVALAILTTLGMWYVAANLVGIVLGFAWNFIGNRKLTWKI